MGIGLVLPIPLSNISSQIFNWNSIGEKFYKEKTALFVTGVLEFRNSKVKKNSNGDLVKVSIAVTYPIATAIPSHSRSSMYWRAIARTLH